MTNGETWPRGAASARASSGPRVLEKVAVDGYARRPGSSPTSRPASSRWVIGTASQAGYLFWPTKRHWSNANFGHVLGLPPDHPRVRRLALGAYREYARYLVELMHLETADRPRQAGAGVIQADLDHIEEVWRASPGWPDLRPRPRRQQRGGRGGCRRARLADQRRRRRFDVPRDVRALPAPPRRLGRPRHPVAKSARDLQRSSGDARCWHC